MSTARSPIRSRQRETISIRRPQRALVEVVGDREHLLHRPPVRAVDQLVELDERLGARDVARRERVDGDAQHLLGAQPHLLERLDQARVAREVRGQLDELRDRHAVVGAALEVEVDVQDREHEPEVARDRRLAREQVLDALSIAEVARVHFVVEADHLLGELGVACSSALSAARSERSTRSLSAWSSLSSRSSSSWKLVPHPKRPVT